MSAAPRTAADVQALGLPPVPTIGKAPRKVPDWHTRHWEPSDWRPHEGVGILCGKGFYVVDLDSHTAQQNAPAELRTILSFTPNEIKDKMCIARSTGGKGRYICFKTNRQIASRNLYNSAGVHIGELLGQGKQVIAPTDDRIIEGSLDSMASLTAEEVDILLAIIGYHSKPEGEQEHNGARNAIDWEQVFMHVDHNIQAIMRSGRFGAHTLTYQMLEGKGIRDRSDARYSLAIELRKRYGLTREEIAALLYAQTDWGHIEQKGEPWFKDDIACVILRSEAATPGVHTSPTRNLVYHTPTEPRPEVPRTPRGRPHRDTAHDYLDFLIDQATNGKAMLTLNDAAAARGVSRRTITRMEVILKAEGRIKRVTSGTHGYSWIEILGSAKNTNVAIAAAAEIVSEVVPNPTRIKERAPDQKQHIPEGTATPEPDGVWFAVDPADAVIGFDEPDEFKQERLVSAPRAKHRVDLPIEDQIRKFTRQLAKLEARIVKERRLKMRFGVAPQLSGLERAAGEMRQKLAPLKEQAALLTLPQTAPDGEQLGLDAAPMGVGMCFSPKPQMFIGAYLRRRAEKYGGAS
jgi:hypothetical protein